MLKLKNIQSTRITLIDKQVQIEHLYIHVPFCKRICSYCDFYKLRTKQDLQIYFINLKNELTKYASNLKHVKTIYIGGGTPNYLSLIELAQLFEIINSFVNKTDTCEFSIELNPDLISEAKLVLFKKYQVTSLSIGIQSTNSELLAKYDRYNGDDIDHTIKLVKKYFANFCFDFIYNFPEQTQDDVIQDIQFIIKHQPNRISWYSLIIKENTKLSIQNPQLNNIKEEKFQMFIENSLKQLKYYQYEVSNWGRDGFKSIHNIAYWKSNSWIGIGPSASSFYFNSRSNSFIEQKNTLSINNWKSVIDELSSNQAAAQIIYMALRLKDGIKPLSQHIWAKNILEKKITSLIQKKWILFNENILKSTCEGFNFLDDIFLFLLD